MDFKFVEVSSIVKNTDIDCVFLASFSSDYDGESEIRDSFLKDFLPVSIKKVIEKNIQRSSFSAKYKEYLYVESESLDVCLMGFGERKFIENMAKDFRSLDKEEFFIHEYKTLIGLAFQKAIEKKLRSIAFVFPMFPKFSWVRNLVEMGYVANYKFDLFKKEIKKSHLNQVYLSVTDVDYSNLVGHYEKDIIYGKEIGEASNFMRDLINLPPNYCTPSIFTEKLSRFLTGTNVNLDVFGLNEIQKMKMGGLLGVAKGSECEPKFLVLRYMPEVRSNQEKIFLIGKGVTFDSGGISLKPAKNMHEMKGDMSGAACVASVMAVLSKLRATTEVYCLIPLAENMPSGTALKPGDIVTSYDGQTVEILNTDAEGRLILMDAIGYAVKNGATMIIDVATLTGACVVALGDLATGVFSNQAKLADRFMQFCYDSGERAWKLPLFKEYHTQLESLAADFSNCGNGYGGASTAAAFLEKFVKDTPWMHLDIAGTNWANKGGGVYAKGSTSVMISSLSNFILSI